MTERELFEAIGHVDDDLILAADTPVKKRRRVVHLHWQQVVSVAACACIVLGGAAVWRSGTLHKSSIAGEAAMAADVPEAPVIPVWLQGAGRVLPKGGVVPVPMNCTVLVGEALHWQGDKAAFMTDLRQRMEDLHAKAPPQRWA